MRVNAFDAFDQFDVGKEDKEDKEDQNSLTDPLWLGGGRVPLRGIRDT
jgi:hypothetical protein